MKWSKLNIISRSIQRKSRRKGRDFNDKLFLITIKWVKNLKKMDLVHFYSYRKMLRFRMAWKCDCINENLLWNKKNITKLSLCVWNTDLIDWKVQKLEWSSIWKRKYNKYGQKDWNEDNEYKTIRVIFLRDFLR